MTFIFEEISSDDFIKFSSKHPLLSFYQTKQWGELKNTMGWDYKFVGLKENNHLVAATLLLSKLTPIKKRMFYAPRGFLLDYKDEAILSKFTEEIYKYVKKNNGLFVKIDPYVIHMERDINGDIVKDGIDNTSIIEYLKKLGYKHYGFNVDMTKEIQPRFIFVLPLKNENLDSIRDKFSKQTKRHIQHAVNECIVVEEVNKDNIEDFSNVMAHTSSRRGFIDRPKSYYVSMLDSFKEKIKIISAVLYVDVVINKNDEELEKLNIKKEDMQKRVNNIGNQKSIDSLKKINDDIDRIEQKNKYLKQLKEKYGNRIVMSSSMFMISGNEVLYLFGGSYDEFMKFNSQYLLQWEMIKYAIENDYGRYNFYGIEGDFSEKNGVYLFKKGFGGEVVEFIGEFDLVTSKIWYLIYKCAFKIYKTLKNLKMVFSKKKGV